MLVDPLVEQRFVRVGAAAGLTGCLMYALRSSLPLPAPASTALFLFFGPVLVVAYVGILPFMIRARAPVAAVLGSVFGIIAAAVNMMFAAVQLNNLYYMRGYIRAAASDTEQQTWRNILQGVFTVQNGLNYVADFFFDWTILLWSFLMWTHPKFGRSFTVTGVIAGGLHFGLKLMTFPRPPAEAGLFDAGPLIGAWYALVSIQVLRHAKWVTKPRHIAEAA